MFDAIGRKGRTKKLSPTRWILSSAIGAGMIAGTVGVVDVIRNVPTMKADEAEPTPELVFKAQAKPPPPPPPPPPPAPPSTTKPRKNVITKKVVQKEIEPPKPTPIPPKDQPTPTPQPEAAESDSSGGVPGGVPGGVIGGVIGGVVGGTGSGPQDIKEVDFAEVSIVKRVPPVYPPLAKRQNIEDTVVVEVTVSPEGNVIDVRWISGNELFKDAVFAAIRQSQYSPSGVTQRFQQPVRFRLSR